MSAPQAWVLSDHACRFCGSRVLVAGELFRCSGCGVTSQGRPDGICGCGLNPRPAHKPGETRFQCARNPGRSPGSPFEIVILRDGRPTPE